MWEELLKLESRYYILGHEFGSSSPTSHGSTFRKNFPLVKKTIEALYEKMIRTDLLKPHKTEFNAIRHNKMYMIYFNIGRLNPKLHGSRGTNPYGIFNTDVGLSRSGDITKMGYDIGFELDIPNKVIDVSIWNLEGYMVANYDFDFYQRIEKTVDLIYNWIEERVNKNLNTGKRGRDD